jgi:hypothetical protein
MTSMVLLHLSETHWHVEEIIPEYIMGVDNNGGVFVFGAERIIHRYGVVNKGYYRHSFIMPAEQSELDPGKL